VTEKAIDAVTGDTIDVPLDQVGDLLAQGKIQLAQGARVPVIVDDGSVQTIAASDLSGALDAGWRVAGSSEVSAYRRQQQYGNAVQATRAAGEAALRGLSVGLSDRLMVELGVSPEDLRARQEENSRLALAGEIGGALAPLLLTGGASAPAQGALETAGRGLAAATRVAGAPVRGVAAIGRGVQAAAEGLLGESVVARGASGLAAGAVEGGLYGMGHAVSEAALQDAPLTAERLMAGAKTGALWGGAAGGVLGTAAGSIERHVLPALREKLSVENLQKFVDRSGLRQWAQGRGKNAFKRLRADFGDEAEAVIGRAVREEGLDQLIVRGSTWDEISQATKTAFGSAGRRIGDDLAAIDAALPAAAPVAAQRIAQRVRSDVIKGLEQSGIRSDRVLAKRITREFDFLSEEAAAPATFGKLHQLRQRVDDLAGWRAADPNPKQLAYRKIRGLMEDEITTAADSAANSVGGRVGETYAANKVRWRALKWLNDQADNNATSELSNRTVGLTDTIAASSGFTGGTLMRLASGDASVLGSLFMGAMTGAAAGAVNKFLREQGQGIASRIGQKTLDIAKAAEASGASIDKAVNGFFNAAERGAVAGGTPIVARPTATNAASASLADKFDKEVSAFESFSQAPESKLRSSLGDTDQTAPAIAQHVREVSQRGVDFLRQKLPQRMQRASDVQWHLRPPEQRRRSGADMARWLRYAEAVKDPGGVIQSFSKGQMTREGAEVLRVVYPRLHQHVVSQAQEQMLRTTTRLGYGKLTQLSLMLGTPLHFSLEPGFLRMTQGVYANQRQAQQQGQRQGLTPGNRRAPQLSGAQASASQQLQGST